MAYWLASVHVGVLPFILCFFHTPLPSWLHPKTLGREFYEVGNEACYLSSDVSPARCFWKSIVHTDAQTSCRSYWADHQEDSFPRQRALWQPASYDHCKISNLVPVWSWFGASHTYAQCFITDSCVMALEVFLAAQNNFWCRRQCCAPRRSRNCSAACSRMNSLESFEREHQWIWTYSQVRFIHPLLILLGKSGMTILTVRYFCIININLVYIDDVLCHDLSLTSVEGRSHLVSLLCPRWSHSKNYLIKHYQSLLMAFVLNKKNLKIKLHLDALFEIFSSVIFVVSLQNAGRKLC